MGHYDENYVVSDYRSLVPCLQTINDDKRPICLRGVSAASHRSSADASTRLESFSFTQEIKSVSYAGTELVPKA
ncbi:hypothetical protein E4U53_003334 [Claviceps sorghi]|nr:hypothetical protein E4U53_003334 [Claviceps sorghi]